MPISGGALGRGIPAGRGIPQRGVAPLRQRNPAMPITNPPVKMTPMPTSKPVKATATYGGRKR